MTAILYIILGLSIGIGLTLIYLQERFIRERRLLVAMGESERAKSAKMLKDLDESWEKSCAQYKENIEIYKERLENLANETSPPAVNAVGEELSEESQQRLAQLEAEVQDNDRKLAELQSDNNSLQKRLANHQQEISELQGELTFFKGEVTRLEVEQKGLPADNDFIVLADGGHLLPGSVARAFMKK